MTRPYRLAILQSHPIQYFSPLLRRLSQEAALDVTVYFCSRQGAEEYVDREFGHSIRWDVPLLEGYKHKFLPNLSRKTSISGFWSLLNPSIVGELRHGKHDALWVHGHNYFTILLAIVTAKALGIPVLMRCDTNAMERRTGWKQILRRPLMTAFYRHLCSACLFVGTRNRQYYAAHGVRAHRLFPVPYVVDNDFFQSQSKDAQERPGSTSGPPTGKTIVLYASKMTARKRPLDLLQAFEAVHDKHPLAVLAFVGSGEEEEVLKEYVRSRGISDVLFLGFRNQTELPALFAAADVFVLPSENEPWGLVLNEAMCAGVPVLTTHEVGAAPDLVRHGDNGFVFKAGDVEALAGHLDALLCDPSLRRRMGERSRKIIEDWSFERCTAGVLEALAYTHKKKSRSRHSFRRK